MDPRSEERDADSRPGRRARPPRDDGWDDDAEDVEDRTARRRSGRKQQAPGLGLLIGLLVGAGVLVLGGTAVGVYYLVRSPRPATSTSTLAANPPEQFPAPNGFDAGPVQAPVVVQLPVPAPPVAFPVGNDKITKENFDKVRIGMTEREVADILGPPTLVHDNFGGPTTKALHYTSAQLASIITVRDGRVVAKQDSSSVVQVPGPGGGAADQNAKDNYAKVQVGMTEAQVNQLLGPPRAVHDNFGGPTTKALHYPGGIITVRDGKVIAKLP